MRIIIINESFNPEEATLEELFLARDQLRIYDAGYQEIKMETPTWILDKMSSVSKDINHRAEATLTVALRKAEARRSALRTRDEQRSDADAEIAELRKRLGIT